jgi:uncharacterized protein (TIGR00288 family)
MKERIAVLIDAENISYNMIDDLFEKLSVIDGNVIFKRAFGNWSKDVLKDIKWQNILSKHAIVPEHIFDFTKQKNAADIQLVISAMKIMYTKEIDTFVLVTSDSDFTPLAYILKENSKKVIGYGSSTYSRSFKNACDSFEILKIKNFESKIVEDVNSKEHTFLTELPKNFLLKIWSAGENNLDKNGFLSFDSANAIARELEESFNAKRFGFSNFRELIEKDGRFEITSSDKDTHIEMSMKLKDPSLHIQELLTKIVNKKNIERYNEDWISFEITGLLLKDIEYDFSVKNYGFKNLFSFIESVEGFSVSSFDIDNKEEHFFKKL